MKQALAFTLGMLLAVVTGCGGEASNNDNSAQVETAQGETLLEGVVLDAIEKELGLAEVGDVDNTFSLSGEDCQDTLAESNGSGCCVVEMIFTGDDVGFFLNKDLVVAPDRSFAVQVGEFSGTDRSACLKTVKEAIRSIGPVELP